MDAINIPVCYSVCTYLVHLISGKYVFQKEEYNG